MSAETDQRQEKHPAANQRQVGGSHYKKEGTMLQHWDIVVMFNLDYFEGQITKYLFRWRSKGGLQDLLKARHFLDKKIEVEEAKARAEVGFAAQGQQIRGGAEPTGRGYVDQDR